MMISRMHNIAPRYNDKPEQKTLHEVTFIGMSLNTTLFGKIRSTSSKSTNLTTEVPLPFGVTDRPAPRARIKPSIFIGSSNEYIHVR